MKQSLDKESLTEDQKYSLAYMWHEEKLAKEIYLELNKIHPAQQLESIATKSEVKHIARVQELAKAYDINITNLADYEVNYSLEELNNMPVGIFAVPEIQDLYNTLYDYGIESKQASLEVGCMVEVVDIDDLDKFLVTAGNNQYLIDAFTFLRDGSYRHYWAFDKGLKNMGIADGCCSLGSEYCHPEYPYGSTPPKPAMPIGITASDSTYKSNVTIGNYTVYKATHYDIARATSSDGKKTYLARTTASSYADTNAVPGQKYFYFVKAINSAGASDYSAYNVGMRATTVPAPTTITASDGTWASNVSIGSYGVYGATHYKIYRAKSSGGTKTYLGLTYGVGYADKTAWPGYKYYYFVKACNSLGCSIYSAYNTGFRDSGVPVKPTTITASDGTWVSNVSIGSYGVSGATHYKIYRTDSPGGTKSYLGLTYGVGYADTTAVKGKIYYYFVKSCNDKGCGNYSAYNAGWKSL